MKLLVMQEKNYVKPTFYLRIQVNKQMIYGDSMVAKLLDIPEEEYLKICYDLGGYKSKALIITYYDTPKQVEELIEKLEPLAVMRALTIDEENWWNNRYMGR